MTASGSTKWTIDKAHSEIQFKVKHLVIATVTGQFNEFDASLETTGEDLTGASAAFTAKVASISTNNSDRDNHLKSADFFDAENHPEIRFVSTGFKKIDDNRYRMTGNLTIRATTKEVELEVEAGGTVVDPWGNTKAGFEITGRINRFDYGLHWNVATETGGLMVGPEVRLALNIEMMKI
ncbi:MAG: YceI family protein [Bacteroidales bacterium]|nr:YceI family protein [Lentimicrobiaceae bacterium]MDD5695808.1 YceI family protein [Bacteroidales bacterium]